MPNNIIDILNEKAKLSAAQAFLMENIKAKENLINSIKKELFPTPSTPIRPQSYEVILQPHVDESWGWEQLSVSEYNEYLNAEAFAAHIGTFFHKGGVLDKLRVELPNIEKLEFMEIEVGKKTPIIVKVHHTSEDLLELHSKLSNIHREHEQKVNYFKSKVKNLVTNENARISNENAKLQSEVNEKNEIINTNYINEFKTWANNNKEKIQEFEVLRQNKISEAVNLRIEVSPLFKEIIDKLMDNIKE